MNTVNMNTVTLNEQDKLSLLFNLKDSRSGINHYFFGSISKVIEQLKFYGKGEFINQFLSDFSNLLSKRQLQQLDSLILNCKDGEQILTYVQKRPELTNHEAFLSTILSFDSHPSFLARLAPLCKGDTFTKLEDVIISKKNTAAIVELSMSFEADLLKLKKAIFQTDDYHYIFQFCEAHQSKPGIIEPIDVEYLENLVLNNNDFAYMENLATRINGANVKKIQKKVIALGDAFHMYSFAKKVNGASIDLLRSAILKTNDFIEINSFVERFGLGNSIVDRANYLKRKVIAFGKQFF